jgi:hypothetical protein
MSMNASTAAVPPGTVVIWRTNDRSILRALRDNFRMLLKLELPVPKLSTDTCTPLSRRALRTNAVRSRSTHQNTLVYVQFQRRRIQASLVERCGQPIQKILALKLHS